MIIKAKFVLLAIFLLTVPAIAESKAKVDPPGPHINKYVSANGEARGTVIYIPQIHRSPGTEFRDPINNIAFITQKEIYGYLRTLKNEHKINFYMGEAGMFGELPAAMIQSATKSQDEREIFLRGALLKLEAEYGSGIVAYGSQNPETYEQTVKIVDQKFVKKKLGNFSDLPVFSKAHASTENKTKTEKMFREIVVEKRSLEAVDNFITGMKNTNSRTGVLIYGAGHGEQIISGLRGKGFDVLVISPSLVHKKYPSL